MTPSVGSERDPLALYQQVYVSLGFERAGLFRAVVEAFGGAEVLYPGCFVHLTPSYYWPHVVYVDMGAEAAGCFADMERVSAYIRRRRRYRRAPFVRFIAQDYTQPLPLPEASFAWLLALHAPGVFEACHRYLRPGGRLLTNNHHREAALAADAGWALEAAVVVRHGAYTVVTQQAERWLDQRPRRTPRDLGGKRGSQPYVETDTYFVLRCPGRSHRAGR